MNGNKRTVFVIGAGWIGAPLARQLHLKGHHVLATTRNADKCEALEKAGIQGFLWNCSEFTSGLERSQHLVEIAGEAKLWILTIPPVRRMDQDENEQWHFDVLRAAEQCGVEKLVLLSSTSVYPDSGSVEESDATLEAISPHSGKCMLALEQVFASSLLDVVTLRLGALIGSDRHPGTRACANGWKDPYRKMNATTREDAINACEFALFQSDCIGVFNVVSPHHPSFDSFGKCLVRLGWPKVLFQSDLNANEVITRGREVSSKKLIQSGFIFQTTNLLDWARSQGGRKSKRMISFDEYSIQGIVHHAADMEGGGATVRKEMAIFVHGYKGFKDWGAWGLALDALCNDYRSAFRFDFTHNGVSRWFPGEIIEEQKWSENTYRREIEELKAVCSYWQEEGFDVCLIGHSRGGGIVSIAAQELQSMKLPVSACILWASIADFNSRFPKNNELIQWRKSNRLEIINKRTGQVLYHRYSFYKSFLDEAENLNILAALSALSCPVFIAHSKDDESVFPYEAECLGEASKTHVTWLQEGGHTFGSKEPWPSDVLPQNMLPLVLRTKEFLNQNK